MHGDLHVVVNLFLKKEYSMSYSFYTIKFIACDAGYHFRDAFIKITLLLAYFLQVLFN